MAAVYFELLVNGNGFGENVTARFPSHLLDRKTTALLVIDMQEAFVGRTPTIPVPNAPVLTNRIECLVQKARENGLLIVWTKVGLDNMKTGPYPLLFPKHFKQTVPATLSRTHSDYQIVPTLAKCIQPGDPIIEKDRYSAFFQTNLEIVLRARNIRSLIFSGVTTNVCVESTLRDAFYRDFFCFLLSDCTGTFTPELQKCSEDIISYVFGWVTTTKQIFRAVSRNQRVSNQS